jgi:ABC-type multidrug transport system ATPase subunit
LTVWENLIYFAEIKGITRDLRQTMAQEVIQNLALSEYRNTKAANLSGGNKRKLQVAISIIGSPPIILLDEPSAGMDPESRNQMWKVIHSITSKKSSSVILTTHSMQEAEIVSDKLAIMTKGGILRCFGTP